MFMDVKEFDLAAVLISVVPAVLAFMLGYRRGRRCVRRRKRVV